MHNAASMRHTCARVLVGCAGSERCVRRVRRASNVAKRVCNLGALSTLALSRSPILGEERVQIKIKP